MIHKANLNSIENSIGNIEKITRSFKTIEHLEQTLLDKTKIAKDKLNSLIPHRAKRGLMNALGTAIKFVAGNPDNDDLEILQQSLGVLQTQENKLANNQGRQIQINELFQNKLNNITNSIRKISSKISSEHNTVQGMRSGLEFVNLIWNIDKIIHILEDIEEQIDFSRIGLVNKNILSLEEKQLIADRLKKQNLNLKFLDEIFQYTSASIAINNDEAALLVKTPILDRRTFDLLELHTLKINNTRIDTYVNLVAKHGSTIYYQSTRCDICDNANLIEDDCIYNILNHQTPTCPMTKAGQVTQVKEVTQGIILLDTNENIEVKDSCGNSRLVSEATIVEIQNCTVKIRNYTFHGQPDITHQEEYLIPIYSKPLRTGNFTNLDDESPMLQFQNLEKLKEVQLSLNHLRHGVTFGGATLVAITFLCVFFVYLYKQIRPTVDKKAAEFLPELLTATRVDERTDNESIPSINISPEKTDRSTKPTLRIELPEHQTRTLETQGGDVTRETPW